MQLILLIFLLVLLWKHEKSSPLPDTFQKNSWLDSGLLARVGIIILVYAPAKAIISYHQLYTDFHRFGVERIALPTITLSLVREFIPIGIMNFLNVTVPIILAVKFFRLKKEGRDDFENKKLMKKKSGSLFLIAPVLILLGLGLSLITLYLSTGLQSIRSYFAYMKASDPFAFISKGLLFGIALTVVSQLQIHLLFKWPRKVFIISSSLIFIIVNSFAIALLDYAVSALFF